MRVTIHGCDLLVSRSDFAEICNSQLEQWQREKGKYTVERRIDGLECSIDLLTDFRTSQDNLAAHEDQKDNLRGHHSINETREQLWLV